MNAFFENFEPDFKNNSGVASFVIPSDKKKRRNRSYRTTKNNITFRVPKNIKLELNTKYSTVDITNIEKDVFVWNRSGRVVVSNISQQVEIHNEYGTIDATQVRGGLKINGRSATVTVREIEGNTDVNAHYSKINIGNVDGDVNIENRSGVINAFNITGNLVAKSDYCSHEVTNIQGDVDIESQSGKVSVEDAQTLTFQGDYTSLIAKDIKSLEGVYLKGKSATFELDEIKGPTSIDAAYMKVILNNTRDDISITNKSGTIYVDNAQGKLFDFEGEHVEISLKKFGGSDLNIRNKSGRSIIDSISELKSVEIDSEYGNVDLTIADFNGNIELISKYGRIRSDYDLVKTDNEIRNEISSKGILGNGNGKIRISVRSGDINLRKN